MEFFLIFLATMTFLMVVLDIEEPIFPAIIIAGIIAGSGDSDDEEETDTTKGKPGIVTEKKIDTASQKKVTERLLEDETRIEWENSDTKWNYHKGQIWETQKNF